MSRTRILPTIVVSAMFLVAACSSGSATSAPSAAASQPPASEAPASEAPASAAASASTAAGGAPCAVAQSAGSGAVTIQNFAFSPADVAAKVGDTITWTNKDSTGHTATVKGNETCTTPTLPNGASGSITFSQAGTYDFFCKIHPNMTGKITVS